jgi:hypothetical protein
MMREEEGARASSSKTLWLSSKLPTIDLLLDYLGFGRNGKIWYFEVFSDFGDFTDFRLFGSRSYDGILGAFFEVQKGAPCTFFRKTPKRAKKEVQKSA